MNKNLIAIGICCMTAFSGLAGCTKKQANDTAMGDGMFNRTGNTLNVNTKRDELYNDHNRYDTQNTTSFGYVRQQKSPIMGERVSYNRYASINREQLANIISGLSVTLPKVHDVATLVTDQHVLVGYHTDSTNRFETADQVKKTAMSVVPRYYHVYVTDNTTLIKRIEALANLDTTSRNATTSVSSVIKDMLNSPQGRRMNRDENENGVIKGQTDRYMRQGTQGTTGTNPGTTTTPGTTITPGTTTHGTTGTTKTTSPTGTTPGMTGTPTSNYGGIPSTPGNMTGR